MRLRGRRAPILTCVVALAATGCGTSAPTHKPVVAVTITTPISGATLGVRQVTVTGTVTPAGAHVLVGGHPAEVSGSNFRRTVVLTAPEQVLTVTAQATGYDPAQTNATVTYSSALAAQMSAANRALTATAATSSGGATLSPSSLEARAVAQAVALNVKLSKSPPTGGHRTAGTKPSAPAHPTHVTPTPSTTPSPLTPAPPSGGSTSGGGSAPVTPPPATNPPAPLVPSPQAITARIKHVWERTCLKAVKGSKVISYCTCIYVHLESTGTFRTPASVRGLVRRVNYWIRTGDSSRLSHAVIQTLATCQARFPGAQGVDGPSSVTPLSGTSHLPVPAKPAPAGPVGPVGTTTAPPIPSNPN